MATGLKKRMKRISASNAGMGKSEVKALAKKRKGSYQTKLASSGGMGAGKKGSVKRDIFKEGGTKANLANYRSLKKADKNALKTQTKDNRKAGIGKRTLKNITAVKKQATKRDTKALQKKMEKWQASSKARTSAGAKTGAQIREAAGLTGIAKNRKVKML